MKKLMSGTQKGGPGKTTTALNIAAALALSGKRVIVWDNDPQADASIGLGVPPGDHPTVGDLILGDVSSVDDIIVDVSHVLDDHETDGKLYVVPAELETLRRAALDLSSTPLKAVSLYSKLTQPLEGFCDYVIFDNRPDLDILVGATIAAADAYWAVMHAEVQTMRGSLALRSYHEKMRADGLTHAEFLGIVVNRANDTEEAGWVYDELDSQGVHVFPTKIKVSPYISKAFSYGRPCVLEFSSSAPAERYISLTADVLQQMQLKGV